MNLFEEVLVESVHKRTILLPAILKLCALNQYWF